METPNFGECQLQQCINTEFSLLARNNHKKHISAVVPTLTKEKVLGWDSGFFFPWLSYVPLDDQQGCNFFLQYKLSTLMVGHAAKQYSDWEEPYFRFKIPHGKNDYHQYEALRALAVRNCEVYYATNQVTTREELFALAENQNLIDNTPFLDVRDVTQHHRHVTFTATSDHFFLHSEPVQVKRLTGNAFIERVAYGRARPFAEDNALVFEIICEQLGDSEMVGGFVRAYERLQSSEDISQRKQQAQRFVFLQAALMRYFNIAMMRYWVPMVEQKRC